jgi:hypothetical protein
MIDWKDVRDALRSRVRRMEEHIPAYDYSEEHRALRTDEKVVALILRELRKSKGKLFDLLDTSYEMQRESLTKDLHSMRDDIDIFLDELKVRRIKWDREMSTQTAKDIVKLDVEILNNTLLLEKEIEGLKKALLSAKKTAGGFPENYLEGIEKRKAQAKKVARALVVAFKLRDALFGLERKTDSILVDQLRKEIEGKY